MGDLTAPPFQVPPQPKPRHKHKPQPQPNLKSRSEAWNDSERRKAGEGAMVAAAEEEEEDEALWDHQFIADEFSGASCVFCGRPEHEHIHAPSTRAPDHAYHQGPRFTLGVAAERGVAARRDPLQQPALERVFRPPNDPSRPRPGPRSAPPEPVPSPTKQSEEDMFEDTEQVHARPRLKFVPVEEFERLKKEIAEHERTNDQLSYELRVGEGRFTQAVMERERIQEEHDRLLRDKREMAEELASLDRRVAGWEDQFSNWKIREQHLEQEIEVLQVEAKEYEQGKRAASKLMKAFGGTEGEEVNELRHRIETVTSERDQAIRDKTLLAQKVQELRSKERRRELSVELVGDRNAIMKLAREEPMEMAKRYEDLEGLHTQLQNDRGELQRELDLERQQHLEDNEALTAKAQDAVDEANTLTQTIADLENELVQSDDTSDKLHRIMLAHLDHSVLSILKGKIIRQITVGSYHGLALTEAGQVFSWGYGAEGQLGQGEVEDCPQPKLVEKLEGQNIKFIACGANHCLALSDIGTVFSWGQGEDGQLGHGDRSRQLYPRSIDALCDIRVVRIACGWSSSSCLSDTADVYTWGNGYYGQLGHGEKTTEVIPRRMDTLPRAIKNILSAPGGRLAIKNKWKDLLSSKSKRGQDAGKAFKSRWEELMQGAREETAQKEAEALRKNTDQLSADEIAELRNSLGFKKNTIVQLKFDTEKLQKDVDYLDEQVKDVTTERQTIEHEIEVVVQQLPLAAGDRADALAQMKADKESLLAAVRELLADLEKVRAPKLADINRNAAQIAHMEKELTEMKRTLAAQEEQLESIPEEGTREEEKKEKEKEKEKEETAASGAVRSTGLGLSDEVGELEPDTEQFFDDIFALWVRLNETSVERVRPPHDAEVGLKELIDISNEAIDDIIGRGRALILSQHVTKSHIKEQLATLLMDNAELRKTVNNYYEAIMNQTIRKMQNFKETFGTYLLEGKGQTKFCVREEVTPEEPLYEYS